jgi:hypothetical protein
MKIINVLNEKGIEHLDIKRIIREFYNFCEAKSDNSDKIEQLLEISELQNLITKKHSNK